MVPQTPLILKKFVKSKKISIETNTTKAKNYKNVKCLLTVYSRVVLNTQSLKTLWEPGLIGSSLVRKHPY